jgi:GT2 family glycosyltransferase
MYKTHRARDKRWKTDDLGKEAIVAGRELIKIVVESGKMKMDAAVPLRWKSLWGTFLSVFLMRQTQLTRFERDQRSHQADIAAREADVAITKTALGSSGLFDAAWYLAQFSDVTLVGRDPLAHYLTYGANEGRDPHPLFDTKWYLAQYPDVAAVGMNPLAHYVLFGAMEGRDPNPLFDTDWYLAQYTDVAATGANPLAHYLTYGANEGRDPSPHFDTDWYVARCPDVEKLGLNPLTHYLLKGRAEGRLTVDPNTAYTKHVFKEQQRFAIEQPEILRHVEVMLHKPTFVVVIEGSDRQARERTMAAFERQLYPYWRASDLSGSASIAEAAKLQEGEYFLWLRAGDLLHERALYMFASALNMDPATDLVYADEDQLLDGCTRSTPFYKPDWSPDYLESFNYIGPAACFGGSLASECLAGTSGYYDFVLRFTERTDRIAHLRSVLCHRERGATETRTESEAASDIEALNGRLRRTGRIGTIAPSAAALGCYDAKLTLSSKPLVSLVIPTAGKTVEIDGRRVDLIINCLDTITERSTYRNLELVIVDNGDLGDARVEALRKRGCKMITFGEQRFNVAKKLNLGASIATGEILLLLNDDIEPLNPDWVERLLEQLEKPHVGVVGAKLLYSNGKTQHVGAVLNSGNPDHVRRLRPRDDLGYFFSTCGTRNFSAVTGASMMTRTEIYRRVGGYNEALAVSFNDVDYCLRVRECGYTVVYAPQAELVHFESQSHEAKLDNFELEYFHRRWAEMVTIDPFYNEENLTVASPTFEVEHNRRQL